MSSRSRFVRSLFLTAALASSVLGTACAEHHYYRVYDPYYSDYHVWNQGEVGYYNQWARETHRDPNRDFRKLPDNEKKEYFTWRHSHGDNDHH
jgi:hypothetical protein